MQVGNVELELVSDGTFRLDAGGVFGIVPKVLWERVVVADDRNRITLALNCLLVRSRGKKILIETGVGDKLTPRLTTNYAVQREGGLMEALGKKGIKPEDIDIVINTHLHFDHCGGNTMLQDGSLLPTFPRAEYWVQRGEWEAALHPNERTRATYLTENLLPLEERGQLRLLEGDTPVTDEVRCVLAPGHTAYHQVVLIESQGQTALCLGDLAQLWIQLERLAWISAYDVEPLVSLEVKRRILSAAATQQSLIIPIHSPDVGHLVPTKEGFRFVHEQPMGATSE